MFKDNNTLLKLYKYVILRHKLEYCVQSWCPYLRKGAKCATRLMVENKSLSRYERLAELSLTTSETRRLRDYLTEVLKNFLMDLYLPTIYQKINSFSYEIPVNVFIYSSHMFCYVIESIFFSESR